MHSYSKTGLCTRTDSIVDGQRQHRGGRGLLGAVFPDCYPIVFTPQVVGVLNGIAAWAVMLFVWIAGIELDLEEAGRHRRESLVTAGLALAVPLLCGAAIAAVLLGHSSRWLGNNGQNWPFTTGCVAAGCCKPRP